MPNPPIAPAPLAYDGALAQAIDAAVGSGIEAIDISGVKVHANDAFCRMVGWSREELVGQRPPFLYWPEEDYERIQRIFQLALDGRFPAGGVDLMLKRRNGERFPALLLVAPLVQGGQLRGWVANILDLSEKVAQAEALRLSEQRLLTAQEGANVGIWELDLVSGHTYWSPECKRLNGIAPDAAPMNDEWRRRVHPDDLARMDAQWSQTIDFSKPFESEYRVRLDSGEERWLLTKGRAQVDAAGRPVWLRGINIDITARRQADQAIRDLNVELEERVRRRTEELETSNQLLRSAKEAAEEASRAKTVFLRTMSHELRTPLNAIIGFSALLLDGSMGSLQDEQRKAVGVIHRSSTDLLALIQDLLDLSRIESGGLTIQPAAWPLREVLREQCELVQAQARQRGLDILLAENHAGTVVEADRTRLSQVVRNLLDNAIKFTDHGVVRVTMSATGTLARVEVEDSGIGIAAEAQPLLFRPFQRVETPSNQSRPGTGLGLAISRHIVEAMGGTIGVDSEPGRGSRFWFTVPLASGRN